MRIAALALVLLACGSNEPDKRLPAAGSGGEPERDSGVDAAPAYVGESGKGGFGGSSEPDEAGREAEGGAGSAAATGGGGGSAEAGSGGTPVPAGGAGANTAGTTAQPSPAGSIAPQERVLWSQSWSVAIHSAVANGGYENATMGLLFDAGTGCRFGTSGSPSGTTQTYPTDGACITGYLGTAVGSAVIYDKDGSNAHGSAGRTEIVGWKAAVMGHKVTALRRTQTYTIKLNGTGPSSYNYADLEGKWEAIGF